MSKVIMIPEDRYNRMIESYDRAVSELEQIKGQLVGMRGFDVPTLEVGVDDEKILEELFIEYASNGRYRESGTGDCYPVFVVRVMDWLEQNMTNNQSEELGELVMDAFAECEKQWFIRGFRYAAGIWRAC